MLLFSQVFSFREIKKRGSTKNPHIQLLLLQEAEPERTEERRRCSQPAVSTPVTSGRAAMEGCFSFFWLQISRIHKRKHNRVKTWTRHVDLFQKDFIFVPINEA